MLLNRISATFFIVFALLMLFYIIPTQVEEVDYGWVSPATIPNLVVGFILVLACIQLFFTRTAPQLQLGVLLRACGFFCLGLSTLWAMSVFGFIYIAPLSALFIMLLIGERRILWLTIGSAVIPFIIWLIIDVLLNRQLP
jgi:putative tricarboxylic transport membrane protein